MTSSRASHGKPCYDIYSSGLIQGSEFTKLMATKKQRIREARGRLKTAKEQWNQASVHAWEPAEPAEAVTKCFYSLENALTAAATALGERWTTKHYEKA